MNKSVTMEYTLTFENEKNNKRQKSFRTQFPIQVCLHILCCPFLCSVHSFFVWAQGQGKTGHGSGDRRLIRTCEVTKETGFIFESGCVVFLVDIRPISTSYSI